ncbi:MAG: cupin domain-containing protein [Dehalococcoidales bacterium]|nr:cupin domain-containing protein [Dehalococcoidales bacterium]
MTESRYEKYITRKPAIVLPDYSDAVPEGDVPIRNDVDTGPMVIYSPTTVPTAHSIIEYGIISGDVTIGAGEVTVPHKHDYEEIFMFLGTNPKDTTDLGCVVEFWLGEGDEREKVVFTTSASIYIPPGLVHFPQIWRNVIRPAMTIVVMPNTPERILKTLGS